MAREKRRLDSLLDSVISSAQNASQAHKIVDIITFCEDPKYLNFAGQGINLWPMQKIVLKLFYRGSEGNEHVCLDDREIEILKSIHEEEDLDYNDTHGGFGQVIEKYMRRETEFTHLLLIMGRRSSKTMIVSIMAAYEAYKLCEAPEGNPQKKYGIAADKPIHIINVAVNESQALDPLFAEIEARIARSPYFADKLNGDASIKGKLYLLTDADKVENTKRQEAGMSLKLPGSIIMMSGHSNSSSLRGHATKCVFFDEFAHFPTTSGKSSGDELYSALQPSMRQFGKHGKIVMLSDPKGKDGMFWRLFELSQERVVNADGSITYNHDDYLAIQLPTWRMNPNPDFSYDKLHKEEYAKDPVAFLMSWNARFLGAEGANIFDPVKIDQCIDLSSREAAYGDPSQTYYIHLDPATTSHNYAICMVHPVMYTNGNGAMKRKIIVDYIKFWKPTENGPVKMKEVEDTVRYLCRHFRVVSVTFDSWQSQQTIQNLLASGIRAFITPFSAHYINQVYGEMKNLINEGDIVLYPNEQLIGELKSIKGKILGNNLHRFFDKKGKFRSDDCCDALCGAAYQAMHSQIVKTLPRSTVVYTGRR